MAQQANITLNTVVYTPAGTTNGISSWVNRTAGVGNGFSTVTEKFTDASKGTVERVLFTLDVPIVSATDTACVCAGDTLRTSTVQISVWIPAASTSAERLDLFNRIRDLAASAPFIAAVQNLDPSWG